MTTVEINPGVCGFITKVTTSESECVEQTLVNVRVQSSCMTITNMMKNLGDTFEAFELCLAKPGDGPLFDYAKRNFPAHAACPVLVGITKCAEAECGLALKKNVSIEFVESDIRLSCGKKETNRIVFDTYK